MAKTFVGFGFGPIQSALFLFEAYLSGNFDRFVVAEVDANLVAAVRANGGTYVVNIARPNRVDQVTVSGIEIYNPKDGDDRGKIIDAISQADELATALPSVNFFDSGGGTSVAQMLAKGLSLRAGKPGILYAAENNNHAAEILEEAVNKYSPTPKSFQFLNTVVGKMSGVISDPAEIEKLQVATMTPSTPKAILVEEFNHILVTKVTVPYQRAIPVFSEKPDLLPFEEAKLYGHNAIHALIGYLSELKGLGAMSEAAGHKDIMDTARAAFIHESGAALIRKYATLGDPLFTPAGFQAYVDDLLVRMVNPHLNDLVARVIRDPERKLGYDDRLFGTMRLALSQGIEPLNMAKGAAAAVRYLAKTTGKTIDTKDAVAETLKQIWGDKADAMAPKLIDLTVSAM
jgi:mannitol-1-phosphate 5-dehydrogenase